LIPVRRSVISPDDMTLCLYIAVIGVPEARRHMMRVGGARPIDPEKTVEA
jgi:hypothetical protein